MCPEYIDICYLGNYQLMFELLSAALLLGLLFGGIAKLIVKTINLKE